jgi:16S rRNA (cytidine(1402)-2'-O)-methyltransferase
MSDCARDAPSEPRRDAPAPLRTGTLFVVATPIGNLEDITLRALRTLREVAVVAAEDTRRSGQLLRHYNIATPLVSLHEHNERQRGEQLITRLRQGESVALVTDAGTPGISDPGALFVRAARAAGVRVDAVPGASAVTATLSGSGLSFDRYAFAGFPPIRGNTRKQWLNWVASLADIPVVGFEAPHRIERTLQDLRSILVSRPIILARELTKLHEEWQFLQATSVPDLSTSVPGLELASHSAASAALPTLARGEFTFIVCPETPTDIRAVPTDDHIAAVFGQITDSNPVASRREALKAAAAQMGLSTKRVYEALERVKKAAQT